MNILLLLILISNVALVALIGLGALVGARWARQIHQFLTPAGEGQPSPAYHAIDAVAAILARAITAQVKTTLMGKSSGEARAEQAVMADIAEDTLDQKLPLAGAILNSFPRLRKSLRRNPALLDLALSQFSKMGTQSGVGNGSAPVGQSPRFKL